MIHFGMRPAIKSHEGGNVCVVGLRGTGKDMMQANVIYRRKRPYVSNVDYHCKKSVYIPLDFNKLNCKNTWKNFVYNDIIPYEYPYPEGCDVYVSDTGVYLPSQYCNEINKELPQMPVTYALSRQLGFNFHCNCQNLGRIYDKLREQSDTYLRCVSCKVLGRIVIQKYVEYDKYQACVDRVDPYQHIRIPLMASKEMKAMLRQKDEEMWRKFKETHGKVKAYTLIYVNKSNYDTRLFKGVLSGKKK